MPWFRCYRCPDRRPHRVAAYRHFEADRPVCPGCGAGEPAVVRLTPVHFLMEDPAGPIWGSGTRWRIGCEPARDQLGAFVGDEFSATPDVRAVTCPSCRGLPRWRAELAASDKLMGVFRVAEDGKGDCCG